MRASEAIYTGAYVAAGSEAALEALLDMLEKGGVTKRGDPDLFVKAYRSFGIDDAHDLRSRTRLMPVGGRRRVFALFAPSMTNEAQNALLKTLEEPAADALLFFVVPSPQTLLPTIRSRVQMLTIESTDNGNDLVDIDDFLAAPAEKRLTLLKPLYEHDDEGRDIAPILQFLQALESRFTKKKLTADSLPGIHALYRARKYAADKGSLLKPLLEQVALLVPTLK